MNKTVVKGILFAITSAVLYGMCAVLTKIATKESLSVSTLIFGRGICGMVFLFLAGGVKRRLPKIRVRNLPKAALYGICGTAATQIFLNLAYFYLPVGTTTTIHFMYPAVVSILNALLFRQKVPWVTMLTLTVSTLSMFLFLRVSMPVRAWAYCLRYCPFFLGPSSWFIWSIPASWRKTGSL